MLTGIFRNIKQFKTAGIWITVIAITKIVLLDLANIDNIYKLIEFIILGAVLMLVSYFYTKNKKD